MEESLITSSGEGRIDVPLNQTRVFVRIEQLSSTATEAHATVAERANTIIETLLAANITSEKHQNRIH